MKSIVILLAIVVSISFLPAVSHCISEGDVIATYSLTSMGITVVSNAFGLASNGTHLIGHSSPVYNNPTTPYYFIRMSDMVVTGSVLGPDRFDTPHPGEPGNTRDLAFGGGYLWATFSGTYDSIVWKLDPVTLDILGMFQTPRWTGAVDSASPTGLAHDGECLWLSEIKPGDERQIIYRMDPSTGAVVDQFDFPYAYSTEKVHGLAFGNGYLWIAGSANIYKYETASKTLVGSCPNPADNNYYEPGFANLDFDGTWLWAADDHNLYKIYVAPPVLALKGTIELCPNVLNLKSNGRWITAYIELPEGYDVADIVPSTLLLNGSVAAATHPTCIGDNDSDGVPDLMVKFSRSEVQEYILGALGTLTEPTWVTLTITGSLEDGTAIEGSDTIRLICPGRNEAEKAAIPV